MDCRLLTIRIAAEAVRKRIGGCKPEAGIILGSGLDYLGDHMEDSVAIPFTDIPGFPHATALGHKGNLVCGRIGGRCVLVMQGRYHAYEGLDMDIITLPIRVMSELGVRFLLVSNACGACNASYNLGDLILVRDHINRLPNPLIGPNIEKYGPRFPDMTCAYDPELQRMMMEIASREDIRLQRGIYLAASGPSYETPAENRFFRAVGADIVGMSTVPEVITARHCGMRVLCISVVSGMAPEADASSVTDGEAVLQIAADAAVKLSRLFTLLVQSL